MNLNRNKNHNSKIRNGINKKKLHINVFFLNVRCNNENKRLNHIKFHKYTVKCLCNVLTTIAWCNQCIFIRKIILKKKLNFRLE